MDRGLQYLTHATRTNLTALPRTPHKPKKTSPGKNSIATTNSPHRKRKRTASRHSHHHLVFSSAPPPLNSAPTAPRLALSLRACGSVDEQPIRARVAGKQALYCRTSQRAGMPRQLPQSLRGLRLSSPRGR